METKLNCSCCGKPTAKKRMSGFGNKMRITVLCEPCWKDPAIKYTDCKHGEERNA